MTESDYSSGDMGDNHPEKESISLSGSKLAAEAEIAQELAKRGFTVSFPSTLTDSSGSCIRVSTFAGKYILHQATFIEVNFVINYFLGHNVLIFPHSHKQPGGFLFAALIHSNALWKKLILKLYNEDIESSLSKFLFSMPDCYGYGASWPETELDPFHKCCKDCLTFAQQTTFICHLHNPPIPKIASLIVPIVITDALINNVDLGGEKKSFLKCKDAIIFTESENRTRPASAVYLIAKNKFLLNLDDISTQVDSLIHVIKQQFSNNSVCRALASQYESKNEENTRALSSIGAITKKSRIKKKLNHNKYKNIINKPWIGFIFVLLLLGLGILLQIFTGEKSVRSWTQVFAALTLIWITGCYAKSAHQTLKESEKQRIDSLRPVLVLRYTMENLGPAGSKTPDTRMTTRLINVGSGPALNISVKSNLKFSLLGGISINEYEESLTTWPDNEIAFGISLGPDTGEKDMHICFISTDHKSGYYTPVHDDKAKFRISYEDVFGNNFILELQNSRQKVSRADSRSTR